MTISTSFQVSLALVSLASAYRHKAPSADIKNINPNGGTEAASADTKNIKVVDEPTLCQDNDCEFAFGKGCVPSDAENDVKCTWQFKLGDMRPSTSCRCAGAGALAAKYGSVEKAFDALKKSNTGITLNDFTELMTKYNVPAYTSANEFDKADKNNTGFLSLDEFKRSAEQLMFATQGNKSMGSSKERCCCKKKSDDAPDKICLDANKVAHTLSIPQRTATNVEKYQSVATFMVSGGDCYNGCDLRNGYKIGTNQHFVGRLGKTQTAGGSRQADETYVSYGTGLYQQAPDSEQIRSVCVHKECNYHYTEEYYNCSGGNYAGYDYAGAGYGYDSYLELAEQQNSSCYHQVCNSGSSCAETQQLSYCGFANLHTDLVLYKRVGTKGKCLGKKELDKSSWATVMKIREMWVGHRVCPVGSYHRTGGGLKVCDCQDECP